MSARDAARDERLDVLAGTRGDALEHAVRRRELFGPRGTLAAIGAQAGRAERKAREAAAFSGSETGSRIDALVADAEAHARGIAISLRAAAWTSDQVTAMGAAVSADIREAFDALEDAVPSFVERQAALYVAGDLNRTPTWRDRTLGSWQVFNATAEFTTTTSEEVPQTDLVRLRPAAADSVIVLDQPNLVPFTGRTVRVEVWARTNAEGASVRWTARRAVSNTDPTYHDAITQDMPTDEAGRVAPIARNTWTRLEGEIAVPSGRRPCTSLRLSARLGAADAGADSWIEFTPPIIRDTSQAAESRALVGREVFQIVGPEGAIAAALEGYTAEFIDPTSTLYGRVRATLEEDFYTAADTDGALTVLRRQLTASLGAGNLVVTSDGADGTGGWEGAATSSLRPSDAPATARSLALPNAAIEYPLRAGDAGGRRFRITGRYRTEGGQRGGWSLRGVPLSGGPVGSAAATEWLEPSNSWRAFAVTVIGNSATSAWSFAARTEGGARLFVTELAAVALDAADIAKAEVKSEIFTAANRKRTVAGEIEEYQVEIPGRGRATITESAIAGIEAQGHLSALVAFRTKTSGGGRAELELIAADRSEDSSAPVSTARIAADTILLDGTVALESLVAGLGRNLLEGYDFWSNDTRGVELQSFGGGDAARQTSVRLREPSESYSGASFPTLQVFQNGRADEDVGVRLFGFDIDGKPARGVPVANGDGPWYEFSVQLALLRCSAQVWLYEYDGSGRLLRGTSGELATQVSVVSGAPDTWPRYWVKVNPASQTRTLVAGVRKHATRSGDNSFVFLHKPQVAESTKSSVVPATWSPGSTTKISGGNIVTDTLSARAVNTKSFAAAGLALFDGTLRSGNFARGSRGWRIQNDGDAEFNSVVVRDPTLDRHLAVGSGTLEMGARELSSDLRGFPTAYFRFDSLYDRTRVPTADYRGQREIYHAEARLRDFDIDPWRGESDFAEIGVDAHVRAAESFAGESLLRVIIEVWGRGTARIEPIPGRGPIKIDWRIYKVT